MYEPLLYPERERVPDCLIGLQEALAERVHDTWAAGRIADGWHYGPSLNEAEMTHPCLVPYHQLPESEKEYDRRTVATTICCILEHGYRILPPEHH